MSNSGLAGKVGIITGAASGAGRRIAEVLAEEGVSVVIADVNRDGAAATADSIIEDGGSALAVHTDVAVPDSVRDLVNLTLASFDHLDILVNNAAALGAETLGRDTDVVTVPLEVWERTLQVNLLGPMLTCRFAIPHLMVGSGVIVNISTIGSLRGRWSQIAYNVSKAGLNALTDHVATTYGRQNIRCNAIAPGIISTASSERHLSKKDRLMAGSHRLIERPGTADDIASAVRFLVSDDSSYITGQILVVDGGTINHLPTYASYGPGRIDMT